MLNGDRRGLAALFHAAHGRAGFLHRLVLAHCLEIFRVGLLVHDDAGAAIVVDGDEIRIGDAFLRRVGEAGEAENEGRGDQNLAHGVVSERRWTGAPGWLRISAIPELAKG